MADDLDQPPGSRHADLGPRVGPYEIVEQIGSGGMATVYRAVQPALRREVALKVLARGAATDAEFLARFRREADVVGRLLHRNIVPVFDYGQDGETLYLAMAYVPGGTLPAQLAAAVAIRIVRQVADALDYAHQHGIIHRDIKPANILMGEPDWPLLTDFGIATMLQVDARITTTAATIGTPIYVSPEQGGGSAPVDGRTDQYSLAIILYELLTGTVPFTGDSPFAIVYQHVHEPVPTAPLEAANVPAALQAVILRALAKNPADRFATAGDFGRAIEVAASGLADPGHMPSLVRRWTPTTLPRWAVTTLRRQRNRPVVPIGIGLVALSGAAIAVALGSGSAPAAATPAPIATFGAAAAYGQGTAAAIQLGVAPVVGPRDGTLRPFTWSDYRESATGGVTTRNLVAEATFVNPPIVTTWEAQVIFRLSRTDRTYYQLTVASGDRAATYTLAYVTLDRGYPDTVTTGTTRPNQFQTGAGAANTVRLILREDRGYLYLNGDYVATFDASAILTSGDVQIAGTADPPIAYRGFAVWPLS